MSNYVPWYGKKKAALGYREAKLLRVLRRGGSSEELARAADEVRGARIRWLRSERSRLLCNGTYPDRFRDFDQRIRASEAESTESIVAAYRRRLSSSRDTPGGDDEPAHRA